MNTIVKFRKRLLVLGKIADRSKKVIQLGLKNTVQECRVCTLWSSNLTKNQNQTVQMRASLLKSARYNINCIKPCIPVYISYHKKPKAHLDYLLLGFSFSYGSVQLLSRIPFLPFLHFLKLFCPLEYICHKQKYLIFRAQHHVYFFHFFLP